MTIARWMLIIALAMTARFGGSLGASRSSRQAGPAPVAVLYDGATIEKRAAHGESHRYEVTLGEGDFLELSVSQDQFLVTVSAYGPDGARVHAINVPDIHPMPERLMFVGSASGRYSIDVALEVDESSDFYNVSAEKQGASPGTPKYVVEVHALRPATYGDLERARVFAVLERAAELEQLQNMEGVRQAIPMYQEAAQGWRSINDVPLEAATLQALAQLAGFFTQYNRESIAAHERLAEVYPSTAFRYLETSNMRGLGTEYAEAGRLEDAKRAAAHALDLSLAGGFSQSAATSVRHLGLYECELGNYDQAREHAWRAQKLAAAIADRPLEALTLWDLSRLDALAGDFDAAIARSRRGLDLAAGSVPAANVLTMWLGFYHLRRGELDEAQSSFTARLEASHRSVQRDQEALTRLGLADVMLARGDRDGARKGYETAWLTLERGVQHWRCIAEQRLGRLDLEDGHLDRAAARFATMAEIARQRQSPVCEVEARSGLADVAARRGDLETADTEARRVVELTEAFRQAAVNLESRALGFGTLAPAYERAIDISMRLAERGDATAVARAIALNERGLARGLLDKVAESRLDARARVPAALSEEHQRVRERWRARLAELQVAMRVRPDAPETAALIDETRVLTVRVRDLEARIDAEDPRHATFLSPPPSGLDAIQALLDHDTVLLEYTLGDVRSYLWVVSAREIRAFTLAPRSEIETLARRVHEQLARSPGTRVPPDSRAPAGPDDRRVLSRLVIEPAASLLTKQRLVLVLPGALSLVPFAVLPGGNGSPLISEHEIVQIPSATTLGAMRTLTAGRSRPGKTAAIFADPIFDAEDPRVRRGSSTAQNAPAQAVARAAGLPLTRLPFSRTEAQEIAALDPRSVSMFLGFEATRERAVGTALSEYRFIHFATHGVVNQTLPSLSSVVLSLVDRAGRPRDGFVMLPDVYDMTLNADVVVLSGCQTALGKDIRGEGPIGLARAFMYAGVPRVVASLWQVDDLATAELMKRFYRGVLVDRLTPASALRAAQQQLAATRRWRSPYFWAPFVLQGDWR